ncbi:MULTISPECIES: hypothetical protein [unclassified Anaeromyxobacter]|uniref:hypothetical protein n=1 Tax=unclassified Anaeromyxobacter TaxID=2620896 RepID=UPI001F56A436|nr:MULTISPECIES: hypothetical protein [unclassified Anaeromyxobacter]
MDRPRCGRHPWSLRALTLAAAAALAAGCTGEHDAAKKHGLGRAVMRGQVRALKASADGAWLAFLDGCAEVKGQYLPPQTASCALRVVAAAGGEARKVAPSVTTLPHGFAWAPQGAVLAALGEYDYLSGAGTLYVARAGGEPARIADGVTFTGFVPGSERVAAIAGGRLLWVNPGEPPAWLPGAEGLSSFELLAKDGAPRAGATTALARRGVRAGGTLLAVRAASEPPARVAERTGEYAFAPGGAAYAFTVQTATGYDLMLSTGGAPARVARQAGAFAFSRDGAALAYVAGIAPGQQGELHVGPLGKPGALCGREVGEFRWAARAPRLAWLEQYDPRVRAGVLGAGGPGQSPRTFGANVSEFEVSADGAHVAMLQHTTRGGYSVDLALAHLDTPKGTPAERVAQGVFGFAFSPDARWLYYRTRCTRNGEACDLERVPAAGIAGGKKPEAVAQGVKSFEFDPRDPGRLLLTWQRSDMIALDVALWEGGKLRSIDTHVLPGTARFLGPDSRGVAYAVADPKRAGVYVADLPR